MKKESKRISTEIKKTEKRRRRTYRNAKRLSDAELLSVIRTRGLAEQVSTGGAGSSTDAPVPLRDGTVEAPSA